MRARTLAVLLVCCAGCSRVELAYPWLDWALEREAVRYLRLTGEQRAALANRIDDYHAWHRATMLPRYAAFLRAQAAASARGPITAAQLAAIDASVAELFRQTLTPLVAQTAELLAGQSLGQIDHLAERLAERHRELIDEATAPPAERFAELAEDYEELAAEWVGQLSEAQRAALLARVRALHADPGPWLAERERRNAALILALRRGATRADIATLLAPWWLGGADPGAPPAYAAYQARFAEGMRGLWHGLALSLDADQRAHLARRLGSWAEGFSAAAGVAQR